MSTADNLLSVLQLFTLERPEWTVDQVAAELEVSGSTAYRYVSSLVRAGLLDTLSHGVYVLGPAFIAYDRQIRLLDPLLNAARPVMQRLVSQAGGEAVALLCRRFRHQVMCVHQAAEGDLGVHLSYERGRPMGLYRGAASLVLLANLPARSLRGRFDEDRAEIKAAGLGDTWDDFKAKLRAIRAQDVVVSEGQLDPGVLGLSTAIRGEDRQVVGSLSLVLRHKDVTPPQRAGASGLVYAAGREISASLASDPGA